MNITENLEAGIIATVATVTAFFFGQSGIFQKILNFILGQKKQVKLDQEEILKAKDIQIDKLTEIAENLKTTCFELEKELAQTSIYVKTLLAYLETLMPNDTHPFIKEMAKEIRENQKKLQERTTQHQAHHNND